MLAEHEPARCIAAVLAAVWVALVGCTTSVSGRAVPAFGERPPVSSPTKVAPPMYSESVDVYDKAVDPHHVVSDGFRA